MICTGLHEQLRLARATAGIVAGDDRSAVGRSRANLELIEQDRFEDLPTGLYGRAAVRAYATAVGIPGDEVLTEVMPRLRTPEDPLDGLARVRGLGSPARATFKEILHVPTPAFTSARPRVPRRERARRLRAPHPRLRAVELTAAVAGVRATEILRIASPWMLVIFC